MRQTSVALGILGCLLSGCTEPTSTRLPTSSRNITTQSKTIPTLTVSSPEICVTRVDWDGSGVGSVDHYVELDNGTSLATNVSPDKPPRSSTVHWNPLSFYGGTNRFPTGRVRATAYDKKHNVITSTDWVAVGFDCGS
jgi:hypothetical protein